MLSILSLMFAGSSPSVLFPPSRSGGLLSRNHTFEEIAKLPDAFWLVDEI